MSQFFRTQLASLRIRFLLTLLFVGIIPLGFLGLTNIQRESEFLTEQAHREMMVAAEAFADKLDSLVGELLRDADAIAALPGVVNQDPDHQKFLLDLLYGHYPDYGQLALVATDGEIEITAKDQEMINISHIHSFQTASTEGIQDWVIAPGLFSDTLLLHMHTPIFDGDGRLVSVLGSPVPLGHFSMLLEEIDTGNAFVLGENGRILLHPDPAERELQREYAPYIFGEDGRSPQMAGIASYTVNGVPYVASYAPVQHLGWTMVIERPEAEILQPITQARNRLYLGMIAALSLGVFLSLLLSNGLVRPVRQMATAVQALGHGDQNAPLTKNMPQVQEIAPLVNAFNEMRGAVIDRENSLRLSEGRNRAILEAIPDTLLRVDKQGKVLDVKVPDGVSQPLCDPQIRANTDYTAVFPAASNQLFVNQLTAAYEQVNQTSKPQIFESTLQLESSLCNIEARCVPGSDGETLIILRDTSQQKTIEADLHKLRKAMETANEGVAILNSQHQVVYANQAYATIHGYDTPEEMLSLTCADLYPEPDFSRLNNEIIHIAMSEGVWRGELKGQRQNGKYYYQDLSLTPTPQNDFVCVVRDITQRKQSEEALQQAQKLDSLGILAGGIAHDFNNLLTGILGHATMAQEIIEPTSSAQNQISKLITSASRAADLTRQLLAYAGKGIFTVGPLDLNQMIRESVGLLETAVPAKVTLSVNLAPHLPAIIANSSQIQQILLNLVLNAAESIHNGSGTVSVRTFTSDVTTRTQANMPFVDGTRLHPGQYVCLEIEDDGVGISPATLKRIFDPFFTTKSTGTGLGLSATLGIIRAYAGGLSVKSEVDKGSTFRVYLQAANETAKGTQMSMNEIQTLEGTALIIDDQPAILDVASDMLRSRGMSVLTALSGEHGVDIFRERHAEIDVVVLDMKMPHMDGEATFALLRQINPHVQVLIASGYSENDTMSHFVNNRDVEFIQKPYRFKTLVGKVSDVLAQSK